MVSLTSLPARLKEFDGKFLFDNEMLEGKVNIDFQFCVLSSKCRSTSANGILTEYSAEYF